MDQYSVLHSPSVFPALGAQRASSRAFSAFSTWVNELAECIRGGRDLSQNCGAETGREKQRQQQGRWTSREDVVATTGCAVAGGAQVVASTASKVEEEDSISTLLTIGEPLWLGCSSWWSHLGAGSLLVLHLLVHHWCIFASSADSPSAIEGGQHAVTNSAKKASWRPPWLGAAAALWRVLSQRCIIPKGKAGE